jgi:hypothetical protein
MDEAIRGSVDLEDAAEQEGGHGASISFGDGSARAAAKVEANILEMYGRGEHSSTSQLNLRRV